MSEEPGPIPGKTFDEWLADTSPKIAKYQKMIEESLSRDRLGLSEQATLTEDANANIKDILSQANAWLDWTEYQEIMKIDRDLTVPERSIRLKVKVMPQRMLRDKIAGIAESLKARMRRAQYLA